jgi:hypothetical protein
MSPLCAQRKSRLKAAKVEAAVRSHQSFSIGGIGSWSSLDRKIA